MADKDKNKNTDIFSTKVVPIMDKVREQLNISRTDEMRDRQRSLSNLLSAAAGPDGGMASQTANIDSLRYTGKWNSKTVEDYITMVNKELKKQGITITRDIDRKMTEKMINEQVPKSSIDYILRKAATSTLFYLPQTAATSPMQHKINKEAERRYNPTTAEKTTGRAIGAVTDYLTTTGAGSTWTGAAKFIGIDMLANAVIDKMEEKDDTPLVTMFSEKDGHQKNSTANNQDQTKDHTKEPTMTTKNHHIAEAEETTTSPEYQSTHTSQIDNQSEVNQGLEQSNSTGDYSGWDNLLGSIGLSGIGDTTKHLGFTLAMLPDLLLGAFTGRTKSIGMNKETLLPLAALISGTFIKNPLIKLPLMLWGGASIVNKAGLEALSEQREREQRETENYNQQTGYNNQQPRYKQYADEQLNARIRNPKIEGNLLVMDIDNIPRIITLPDTLADAYKEGAVPLNTLANSILAKADRMSVEKTQKQQQQQNVSQTYEQSQQREQTRGIR